MTRAFTLSGINHSYGDVQTLKDLSLSVGTDEKVALIGPSGAGKSTLLSLLDGRLRGWSGTARVLESDLCPDSAPARAIRADTGFIFQDFALLDRLSVYQNVMNGRLGRTGYWASLWGRFSDGDHTIVGGVLRDTGLAQLAERRADEISGGQRQRVAIARCIAQEPRLILADEPVSNLDPVHSEGILDLITSEAKKRGIGLIFTSHQPDLSLKFADRVVGLRDGRVVFDRAANTVSRDEIEALYRDSETDLPTPTGHGLRVVN